MISGIANNALSTQIIAESALRYKAGCFGIDFYRQSRATSEHYGC